MVAVIANPLCLRCCRICLLMSSHCFAILGKHLELVEIRSGMSMPIAVSVDRLVRVTIDGRARYLSWVRITT